MHAAAARLRLGPLERRPIDQPAEEEECVRVLKGLGLEPRTAACTLSGVPQPR
jgi:hypothetical protein